ncbi:MAG: QueT transporter family protein [Ruminococcaceae bacterium]|nr:QueT transporter family protein [Oscillospiraceae bacterium]
MKRSVKNKTLFLCYGAIIAALYVVLTLLANLLGVGSGVIQVRFSEMLCLLPIFLPAAIPGVTVGCFLSALLTGAVWLDILVGPIATLIGAVGTYLLRKHKWLAPLPPILSNALIIPFVLAYGYGAEEAIPLMMLTVGIGEVLSIYVLGMLFVCSAERYLKKWQNQA